MKQSLEIEIDYRPHKKQKPFHNSKAKFRAMITGIGFGKSAAGVNEVIKDAIMHPGTLNLIFAPTFPMLRNTTMREFFKFCPHEIIKDHKKTEHIVQLFNGSEIIYLSGDNDRDIDRMRGLTLGSAYGDEIALAPRYIWDIIVGRLRDPNGSRRAWVTTTPKGRTWLHSLFIEKIDITNPEDYEVFTGTSHDNPYTPEDYKQVLVDTYKGIFAKQEIYGQFVGFKGCVYSSFVRSLHVKKCANMDFKEIIGAIDWGFTNPMVGLLLGLDSDGRIYIFKEFYQSRVLVDDFAKILQNWKKDRQIDRFYSDPSEPQNIMVLQNADLNIIGADNEIMAGINAVTSYIEKSDDGKPRLFIDPSCVNTIMEFENYRYPDENEGRPVQEKPLKIHDHAMDALRYAIYSMQKKGAKLVDDKGLIFCKSVIIAEAKAE